MLYFAMLILFLCLVVGPIVAGRFLDTKSLAKSIPMQLLQPTGQKNNDTSSVITGARLNGAAGATGGGSGTASASAASTSLDFEGKFRNFRY